VEELEGKVAVITGAASGIGLGMATRFAEAGMKVVMADIEQPVLDKAVATLRDAEHEVFGVVADVSHPESVEELAREAVREYGAVHVLCNNAGVSTGAIGAAGGPIWELPQEDWDWVYGINFWGVLHGLRAFVPLMLEQGGECHIVNTASIAGFTPGGSIYGSTKKGVVALSETLVEQLEVAAAPIGVTVLCPSFVRTEIATASRNRTGEFKDTLDGDEVPEESRAWAEMLKAAVRDGQDPLDIGDMVVNAIKQNRFYQFTDHMIDETIEMRPGYVLAGTPPTPSKEILRMRSQMIGEAE